MCKKNILISNIGNRNIKDNEKEIDLKNFKSETKKIYENYDKQKNNIQLQILPNHIDNKTKKVFLIVTNQNDKEFEQQDTYYEGLIIKNKITENYKEIEGVELIVYEHNPTDENKLFEELEKKLPPIFNEYSDYFFIFLDAGGTPQMKQTCKEILNYFIPDKHKIVYSNKNDEKKVINRYYSHKYAFLKTALQFAKQYQYSDALTVLKQIPAEANVKQVIFNWLEYANARKNFDRKTVKNFLKNPEYLLRKEQLVTQYAHEKLPYNNFFHFENLNRPEKERCNIFEIAQLCQLHFYLKKDYTIGVLNFYRLIEEISQAIIKHYNNNKTKNQNDKNNFAENVYNEYKDKYTNLQPKYGLPILIVYGLEETTDKVKELFDIIKKTNSFFNENKKGIDSLRNNCYLVHSTNTVNKEIINHYCQGFLETHLPQIFKLINMPEENIYNTINKKIENSFYYY